LPPLFSTRSITVLVKPGLGVSIIFSVLVEGEGPFWKMTKIARANGNNIRAASKISFRPCRRAGAETGAVAEANCSGGIACSMPRFEHIRGEDSSSSRGQVLANDASQERQWANLPELALSEIVDL